METAVGVDIAAGVVAAAGLRVAGIAGRNDCRRAGGFWRAAGDRGVVCDVGGDSAVHGRAGCCGGRDTMSAARRFLILSGIALALWGMSYGLWYAVFAEHQALDGIGSSLATGFSAAAEKNSTAAQAALDQYREAKYRYDRQVDVHGHWVGLALLLIVLGIGFDRIGFSERIKLLLALGLFLGAILFPLGVLLQTFSHDAFPRLVTIAGSGLVIASMAG